MDTLMQHLQSLDFVNHPDPANQFLQSLQLKITRWGTRVVTANGYKGDVSLQTITKLAQKASERFLQETILPRSREENSQIPENDLSTRTSLIDLIDNTYALYPKTDTLIKTKSLITRFFLWFRDFFSSPSSRNNQYTKAIQSICAFSTKEAAELLSLEETSLKSHRDYVMDLTKENLLIYRKRLILEKTIQALCDNSEKAFQFIETLQENRSRALFYYIQDMIEQHSVNEKDAENLAQTITDEVDKNSAMTFIWSHFHSTEEEPVV